MNFQSHGKNLKGNIIRSRRRSRAAQCPIALKNQTKRGIRLNSEFQAWFGVTEDGQRGWKEQGADTVYPFFKTVEIAGGVTLEKVGGPNDDRAYARIDAPDGFEISKIIYSSFGFSTDMYYNFNVGGTTIGNQERANVTNRELDISSAQDRGFLQVLIRKYNESSSGTGSVSYTIQFERKAG